MHLNGKYQLTFGIFDSTYFENLVWGVILSFKINADI